ncbi:ureidoglycolate hydrolase-like [Pyrus ussuriensis x Pyrus communis]|uniref:Ureidoglycolate hydrolase-like n=1 Tax=Pyrus ussuriensis x Pyrus communis TaxID=2448454 RepID=A0A5N5HC19_9ROSA|nr:ureidoglycolate hydrolase-like [Pyrus ussuriensis x Pyrus communis]
MDFFKSVFSDDPLLFDDLHPDAQNDDFDPNSDWEPDRNPCSNYGTGAWSFEVKKQMMSLHKHHTCHCHHSLFYKPKDLSALPFSVFSRIDELSTISDTPAPSVTRVLYTDKDVLARNLTFDVSFILFLWVMFNCRFIKNLMGLSGLSVREDAVGNIFGREGYNSDLSAVATGSHIDAIPYSGKYDGVVGVLGAIEAINVLKRSGSNLNDHWELSCSPQKSLRALESAAWEGVSIGIVTAIAAPASIKVEFEGNGGHAGAVLMPNRNDAGLAAAELVLAVERHIRIWICILELHPGAINSIPSKSHLEIVNVWSVLSEFKIINQDPPALSDKSILEAMEASSKELNLTHKFMISRAYHDSLFMARVSPMGMIFIPCYKGYSHKPEEYASIQDISNGVKVLALTLAKLSLQ